jgi:hypothetical protein
MVSLHRLRELGALRYALAFEIRVQNGIRWQHMSAQVHSLRCGQNTISMYKDAEQSAKGHEVSSP